VEKLIKSPEQIVVFDGVTVTEGITVELTVIVMLLLVAIPPQRLEVISTFTWSPLFRLEVVKVEPPVPTRVVPINH
jgi:hypothetical protein